MVESVYEYERMSSGSGLASIGLSGVQHVDAQGAVLASHGYTYDDAGLVDTYTNDDGQADYSYDATGQLVDADYDYQDDESFNYDLNGNRLEYIVGVNNQVLSDGLYWYEYDEEGARTEKYQWDDLDADGEVDDDERFDLTTYTWDARGRLTKIVTKPDGQTVTKVVQYAYDYLNRRVEKKITDADTGKTAERYTYLGHDIVLQTDKSGNLTHRYLHGPSVDQCLADEAILDDNTLYPLFDNLGSVRDLADHNPSTGETTIVNHIVYDAFGRIVTETDPSQTTIYGHTGRETDPESDLTFHRRRYYDAALGQFISEDPIGFAADDVNMYRYTDNSPTNLADADGLSPKGRVVAWVVRRSASGVTKLVPLYTRKQAARFFARGSDILVRGGISEAKAVANIVIKKGNLRKTWRDRLGHKIGGTSVRGLRHIQDASRPGQHIFFGAAEGNAKNVATRFSAVFAGLALAGASAKALAGEESAEWSFATNAIYTNPYPDVSIANAWSASWWKKEAGLGDDGSLMDWLNPMELAAIGGEIGRAVDREREKELIGVATTILRNDERWLTVSLDAEGELSSVTFWGLNPAFQGDNDPGVTIGAKVFKAIFYEGLDPYNGEAGTLTFGDAMPIGVGSVSATWWKVFSDKLTPSNPLLRDLEEALNSSGAAQDALLELLDE